MLGDNERFARATHEMIRSHRRDNRLIGETALGQLNPRDCHSPRSVRPCDPSSS